MPEELKQVVSDMEKIAEKTFERVKPLLMSNETLSISEIGELIDIAKDSAKIMKYATHIKRHYSEHSERHI